MTEILDASHEVLDLSEHILEMLERATDGKTAGLLAIHAAACWRRSSARLLRALDAAIGGSRP